MSRDTRTGGVLESMVIPSLLRGGYHYHKGVNIGQRLRLPRRHIIDALAWRDDATYLVSSKWQQTPGTAEQKVPFEVMCLLDAMDGGTAPFPEVTCSDCGAPYAPAPGPPIQSYLVLGGAAWTLRDFYIQNGLADFIPESKRVQIVSLETFVGQANRGLLGRTESPAARITAARTLMPAAATADRLGQQGRLYDWEESVVVAHD